MMAIQVNHNNKTFSVLKVAFSTIFLLIKQVGANKI